MIPYEELAAALAGAPSHPAPKFAQPSTVIEHRHDAGSAGLDDATMTGDQGAEVDANDLLADEEA